MIISGLRLHFTCVSAFDAICVLDLPTKTLSPNRNFIKYQFTFLTHSKAHDAQATSYYVIKCERARFLSFMMSFFAFCMLATLNVKLSLRVFCASIVEITGKNLLLFAVQQAQREPQKKGGKFWGRKKNVINWDSFRWKPPPEKVHETAKLWSLFLCSTFFSVNVFVVSLVDRQVFWKINAEKPIHQQSGRWQQQEEKQVDVYMNLSWISNQSWAWNKLEKREVERNQTRFAVAKFNT